MSSPADFGLFHVMNQALRTQSWFEKINGFYTVPPPGVEPPYMLLGFDGLTSHPNLFAPRARVECHIRFLNHQHTHHMWWDVLRGIAQTLDGQCFELPHHDHFKKFNRPFVLFREISAGWIPGLWDGRWSCALLKYVCHIRTPGGFV